MTSYITRRLLLIIPTLFGIMLLNFIIIQAAPGGPVEQMIARIQGTAVDATARVSGSGMEAGGTNVINPNQQNNSSSDSKYRGAQGLDPEIIAELEKMYGFDKPAHTRFFEMLINYATFNFGESFFRSEPVLNLVFEKMPVSITLGLWTTLIVYIVSIPLGIRKAVKDGSPFDVWTSTAIIIGYSIPSFLFAILLIVLFSGGSFMSIFPLRGLASANHDEMSLLGQITDYLWHIALPVTAMVIGGFASLTMLTKNSFLEEIKKNYVITAKAKGLSDRQVLYGHVFRNAMLVVISGLPNAFLRILFTGSLLIEVIFSLDGLGLLGFEAAINRDYPVMFATLYIFTLLGLIFNLLGDITYMLIDPRIDLERRGS